MGFLMFGLEIMVNHWRYETMIQNSLDSSSSGGFQFSAEFAAKVGVEGQRPSCAGD